MGLFQDFSISNINGEVAMLALESILRAMSDSNKPETDLQAFDTAALKSRVGELRRYL